MKSIKSYCRLSLIYQSLSQPPYNLLAHKVSKTENETEYWERVMWGWKTALYWLDVTVFAGKGIAKLAGKKVRLQRLRRADANTTAFFVLAAIVDMGLMSKYLSTLPGEDNSLEEANEIMRVS